MLARKRQELARVIERLRSPQLSHGMARKLGKQRCHSRAGNRRARAGLIPAQYFLYGLSDHSFALSEAGYMFNVFDWELFVGQHCQDVRCSSRVPLSLWWPSSPWVFHLIFCSTTRGCFSKAGKLPPDRPRPRQSLCDCGKK